MMICEEVTSSMNGWSMQGHLIMTVIFFVILMLVAFSCDWILTRRVPWPFSVKRR